MKKLTALILSLILIFSSMSYAEPSAWALPEVSKSIDLNITTQRLLSNYQSKITREEFSELAIKLYEALKGEKATLPGINPFTDTINTEVLKANALGIVGGVGNGKFDPQSSVTREQLAAMFYRVLNAIDPTLLSGEYQNSFSDNKSISSWATAPISFMSTKGIIGGVGENRVDPKGSVTREVAILMAVRLFNKFNSVQQSTPLTIQFIDVGQGDCILITDGSGNDMLIDGGDSGSFAKIKSELSKYNIDDFEYVIATHPHEDHIGSLDNVIDTYKIEKVIIPNVITDTASYRDLDQSITKSGAERLKVSNGDIIKFGDASITILSNGSKQYEDINNNSIVIRVDNGTESIVLTGDAGSLVEQEIVSSGMNIDSDYLKLGHHGSGTSTTAQFLYKTSPLCAVISVGVNNMYGHPDPLILNRLNIQGVKSLYRTDLNGDVFIKMFKTSSLIYSLKGDVSSPSSVVAPATPSTPVVTPASTPSSYVGKVTFVNIDKQAEVVTIKNTTNSDIVMTGWKIVSVKGNQQFTFPTYTLKAGSSVRVGGYGSIVDLKWEDGKGVWNNSDDDDGILLDSKGNQIDFWND